MSFAHKVKEEFNKEQLDYEEEENQERFNMQNMLHNENVLNEIDKQEEVFIEKEKINVTNTYTIKQYENKKRKNKYNVILNTYAVIPLSQKRKLGLPSNKKIVRITKFLIDENNKRMYILQWANLEQKITENRPSTIFNYDIMSLNDMVVFEDCKKVSMLTILVYLFFTLIAPMIMIFLAIFYSFFFLTGRFVTYKNLKLKILEKNEKNSSTELCILESCLKEELQYGEARKIVEQVIADVGRIYAKQK